MSETAEVLYPKSALEPADYKSGVTPIWCLGCGDFSVLPEITRALVNMQLPREDVAVISGIGCSSRIPAYTSCYGFHRVHGRAMPVSTGLKVAPSRFNSDMHRVDDGDDFSIGGNHFLQAKYRYNIYCHG